MREIRQRRRGDIPLAWVRETPGERDGMSVPKKLFGIFT